MAFARSATSALACILYLAACVTEPDATEEDDGSSTAGAELGAGGQSFTAFESGQVRPLAVSADRTHLYAVNTPDNRVEIFRIDGRRLRAVASVPVGLEPVALAERPGELWVVNHLSDSISIIDITIPARARVKRTLAVGDEPRDIVFASAGRRAFITTAHRGQNTGRDPQLTTPGVGRADVWVYDAQAPGAGLTGTPLTVITLFADTPRALAVSADGRTVYAAAFQSGNQTTALNERVVTRNGFLPPPFANAAGFDVPPGSIIVKFKTDPTDGQKHWLDNIGRRWDDQVKLNLPDKDVFAIDATTNPPAPKASGTFSGVGTVLFNMAVNPVTGKVYVANIDARNDVRFEGHNLFGPTQGAPAGSVRGHFMESRITAIDPVANTVRPRHLNKHLNYNAEGTPAEAAKSLAFPTGMAVTADGRTLFVAALGSSKVGVFSTAELEADTFTPSQANQIPLSGGGPTGLALAGDTLFVMTRFDNGISIVDTRTKREVEHVALFNPEPVSITRGRKFLYDATLTSGHGDSACAGCHIFGDFDSLAWDLGDPDGGISPIPGPFTIDPAVVDQITGGIPQILHSLKGPMTTQSLRGMANHGPMHWRGDRTGGLTADGTTVLPSSQPDTGSFNEDTAFKRFNPAFTGLLGRSAELTDAEMADFTNFMLQVVYPPNPIRNLDNSLTADQAAGRAFYFQKLPDGRELPSDAFHNCDGCHTLNPSGNAEFGVAKPGFFGSDGRYSFEAETQFMKVAHLRNMYQKVGMFGNPNNFDPADNSGLGQFLPPPYNDVSHQGDQVRGFGFLHDGTVDTTFRFFGATVFVQRGPTDPLPNPGGFPIITSADPAQQQQQLIANITARRQMEAFVLAYDSNLAPIVGQQVTLSATSSAVEDARLTLLEQRAAAGECEVVAFGQLGGRTVGFLYDPATGRFTPDLRFGVKLPDVALRALRVLTPVTFTAAPLRSGRRIALDRDLDGVLNGDE
jgi:DNA-binding beta-propeller fold protein YncE